MKQFEVQPCTLGTPEGPEIIVRASTAREAAEEVMQESLDKDGAVGRAQAVVSFADDEGHTEHVPFRKSYFRSRR